LQEQLVALAGRPKREFVAPVADTSLDEAVAGYMGGRLRGDQQPDKAARQDATSALQTMLAHFTADEFPEEELPARVKAVQKAF
jgi:polyribonucleotide nucleotidyltransferase